MFFLSFTGEQKTVQTNTQMNVQANQKVQFRVKDPSMVNVTERAHTKENPAEAAKEDDQKKLLVKDNSHQLNHAIQEDKEVDVHLQQGKQVNNTRFKTTDHISAAPGDTKVEDKQGVMNGAANGEDSALMRGRTAAGVNKQQSLCGSASEGKTKEGSRGNGKPVVTHLTGRHMSTPIISMEPLGIKVSCDEMQSMEIR